MSKLLINEQPLQVIPSLAKVIGLNEAIFIQQLHYLLTISKNQAEGRKWVYNRIEDWHLIFPFWSLKTVQRVIKNLEETGLMPSTNKFNRMKMDKTKWYSINYEKLAEIEAEIEASKESQNDQMTLGKNEHSIKPTWGTPFSQNDQMTLGQNDQCNNHKNPQDYNTQDITPLPPQGESADAEGEDEKIVVEKKSVSATKQKSVIDYQAVADLFNQANAATGERLPKVIALNDKRKRAIKKFLQALKEPTLACAEIYFSVVFENLRPFYLGENDRGWVANFDYVIRENVVLNVREGSF